MLGWLPMRMNQANENSNCDVDAMSTTVSSGRVVADQGARGAVEQVVADPPAPPALAAVVVAGLQAAADSGVASSRARLPPASEASISAGRAMLSRAWKV